MRHEIVAPLLGIKPASLAIEGKVLSTGPPGKSLLIIIMLSLQIILLWFLLPFDLPSNFLLKRRNVLDNRNWGKWDVIWKFILKYLRVYVFKICCNYILQILDFSCFFFVFFFFFCMLFKPLLIWTSVNYPQRRSSCLGFQGGSDGKESACNAKDLGSIPGLWRSPGEGNSNPLQYSCLENPMVRGAW